MAHGTRSLFPHYDGSENRVTYATLAVFERISLPLLRELLAAIVEDSDLQLVTFESQPRLAGGRQPDAAISAGFRVVFEVKREPGKIAGGEEAKLRDYLTALDEAAGRTFLVVLTPDVYEPALIKQLRDPRLVWVSFLGLHSIIDKVIADDQEGIADRDRFLLRELQALFQEDGLLDVNDVAVVAARIAYREYLQHHAYMCQPATTRKFPRSIQRIGFYADGEIKPELPQVIAHHDALPFTAATISELRATGNPHNAQIADIIATYLAAPSNRLEGSTHQFFLLSPHDDERTLRLAQPVKNTTTARSGRGWAWTLGQRYTRSDLLTQNPRNTDELDRLTRDRAGKRA